jgi:hypothetical protein
VLASISSWFVFFCSQCSRRLRFALRVRATPVLAALAASTRAAGAQFTYDDGTGRPNDVTDNRTTIRRRVWTGDDRTGRLNDGTGRRVWTIDAGSTGHRF